MMITMNIDPGMLNALYRDDAAYYFMPHFHPWKHETISAEGPAHTFDADSIRRDFPILHRKVHGKALIWFDNAATTQKPACVLEAMDHYYRSYNSNVHRGAHTLSMMATQAYESARRVAQTFLGSASEQEIIFLRGTTEGINLVAQSFGMKTVKAGDEILVTQMEHHSNIVPWQLLAKATGSVLRSVPMDDKGQIDMAAYKRLLSPRTRIAALSHVSNVLGTINPIKEMIEMAHQHGVYVLIDGAQAAAHMAVDVQGLDADFYVFSGHKVYGPMGIGILYGKASILEDMPPWQSGGGMIQSVDLDATTYSGLPHKFEAGTGNIAAAIGLAEALTYVKNIGMDRIEHYEKRLTAYAADKLAKIPGLQLIGTAPDKTSVLSFVLGDHSPENVAMHLNRDGIAVRAGHHCAQPALKRFGLKSSVRASLGIYNTKEEIDAFADSIASLSKNRYL